MVECKLPKLDVAGSSPVFRSKNFESVWNSDLKVRYLYRFLKNILLFVFIQFEITSRGLSSVGLEHLPYKQRVGGSTPSAPTVLKPYKQITYKVFLF